MKVEFQGLHGTQYGATPIEARKLADFDARHVALETFKLYINRLTFSRTGEPGAPSVPYRIGLDRIHTEQPNDPTILRFPSISMIGSEAEVDTYGLGPPQMDEATADVFGAGTVLVSLSEHVEELNVELWADEIPQRRSLVSGMHEAMMPLETSASLMLKLPSYYDRVASFSLMGVTYIDDPDVIRGRRRAQLRVLLNVPTVALVNYTPWVGAYLELDVVDAQVEALAALKLELAALQV